MNLFEDNTKVINFYNKHTNSTNGSKYISSLIHNNGVSVEYLYWITVNNIVHHIPLFDLIATYNDWKKYVVEYYKNKGLTVPIDNLSYEQVCDIIDECKRYYNKPNPIYDENNIFVGLLKNYNEANMLPINANWCIMNNPKRFAEFCCNGKVGYYIINKSLESPYKYVIAIVSNGEVEYWDSKNCRMSELPDEIERFKQYESFLPKEVKQILYTKAAEQGEEIEKTKIKTENNMKKQVIRLTESDLRQIIKETVKNILNLYY